MLAPTNPAEIRNRPIAFIDSPQRKALHLICTLHSKL